MKMLFLNFCNQKFSKNLSKKDFYDFLQFLLGKSCKKSIGFWYFDGFRDLTKILNRQNIKILWFYFWDLNFLLYFLILFFGILGFYTFWPFHVEKWHFLTLSDTQKYAFSTLKMPFLIGLLTIFWWFLIIFWSLLG